MSATQHLKSRALACAFVMGAALWALPTVAETSATQSPHQPNRVVSNASGSLIMGKRIDKLQKQARPLRKKMINAVPIKRVPGFNKATRSKALMGIPALLLILSFMISVSLLASSDSQIRGNYR